MDRAVRCAIEDQAKIVTEYRVVLPDGTERWLAARGRLCSRSAEAQARVLGVSVDITERKRAEQALKDRLRFEQLLSDLSAKFINQPPDQIDSVIDDSLKRLLETLGHDRSSLGQVSQESGEMLVTHSCAVSGLEPFPVGVLVDDYVPWIVGEVRNGKTLFLKCLPDDFPPEADEGEAALYFHGRQIHRGHSAKRQRLGPGHDLLQLSSDSVVIGPRKSSLACK